MDFNIEVDFVKKYIKKDFQDRLIFELQSKKHRERAIDRFSHFSQKILNNCFKCCNMLQIQELVCEKYDVKEKCYIISGDENDGKILFLHDAVKSCQDSYTAMILISEKFVLVKEELEKTPIFYLSI